MYLGTPHIIYFETSVSPSPATTVKVPEKDVVGLKLFM